MDNITVTKLVKRFIDSPGRMNMGAGKMSKRYNCTAEEAKAAKKTATRVLADIGDLKRPASAKVLIFDIETAPLMAYVWGTFKQHISPDQMLTNMHYVLTWAAKWVGNPYVMNAAITTEEVKEEDDKRIVKELRDLIDEADILIAHNGDKFDIPIVNTRCLLNGIAPPSSFRTVDTLKVAKKSFRFPNNKLQTISQALGMEGKISTSFALWKGCLAGDQASIDEMLRYNIQDVVTQEEVYMKLRPWIKSHPNMALYEEDTERRCTNCGSDHLKSEGVYHTNLGKFETYVCKDCGAIAGRARKSMISKEKNKSLLMPTAR